MSRSCRYNQMVQDARAAERRALIVPARTTTAIVRPNPALLGTQDQRDTFADEQLRRERNAELRPKPYGL